MLVSGILCGLLTQNDNCNHGRSKCYGYCVFYGTFFRVLTVNWTESNWTLVLTIRSPSRKVSPLEHNLWTFSWWWLLWLINVTIWSPVESERELVPTPDHINATGYMCSLCSRSRYLKAGVMAWGLHRVIQFWHRCTVTLIFTIFGEGSYGLLKVPTI